MRLASEQHAAHATSSLALLACARGDENSGVKERDSRLERDPVERSFLRFLSDAFDETLALRPTVLPSSATSADGVRLRADPAEELSRRRLALRVLLSPLERLAARWWWA